MSFNNHSDVIDSRDIIERIAELEEERDGLKGTDLNEWESENREELATLLAVQEECQDYASDWSYGESLIHESYFPDYCQLLAEEIGDVRPNMPYYIVIDWEATAENIKEDYMEVDFDGETYLIRCT